MKERYVVSILLVFAFCALAFAIGVSPGTQPQAQEQTLADITRVGAAMFSWLTDQVGAAAAGQPQSPIVYLSLYEPITSLALETHLVPTYLEELPELDGWDHSYAYYLNTANPLAAQVMAIRSDGRNKAPETNIYTVTTFDRDDFDQDILWADGYFIRWPGENQGVSFYTLPPCRVLDTRPGSALQSGVPSLIQLGGACGAPASAKSVEVNLTVVGPTGAGYVTLFPADLPVPSTSTITFAAGQTRTSNAVIKLPADGTGAIGAQAFVAGSGQVHVIVDVGGYFE